MAGTTAAAEAEVREVYSQLSIDEEEEVGLVFKEDEIRAEKRENLNLQFCLVGRVVQILMYSQAHESIVV